MQRRRTQPIPVVMPRLGTLRAAARRTYRGSTPWAALTPLQRSRVERDYAQAFEQGVIEETLRDDPFEGLS